MAMQVAKLGFDLSAEGNLTDKDGAGAALVPNPPKGRKGYEEWIQANVTTLHDVDYAQSQNIQVVIYE